LLCHRRYLAITHSNGTTNEHIAYPMPAPADKRSMQP
jgi:hypothetical protein